jgi:hypothetical protein
MDWYQLAHDCSVAGSYKPSGSKKGLEFIYQLSEYQLLKKDYTPSSSSSSSSSRFGPSDPFCSSIAVVPKRYVATPWCVARDHEVCREIKKYIFKLILIMIKN